MATLMELRRLTRARLGIPVSDDFMGDPVLDDHINMAVQAIEGEYRWPWSDVVEQVTVTSDAPDIPRPDGHRATRAVFDGDTELAAVSPGDLLTWMDAHGAAQVWCPIVDAIVVRPIVPGDTSLTHYWSRQSIWMADDADTPAIPDQFSGAIVAKAAELLSMREGAGADAGRHNAEFASWIARMRRDVRTTTGPTRVRVRPGSWI